MIEDHLYIITILKGRIVIVGCLILIYTLKNYRQIYRKVLRPVPGTAPKLFRGFTYQKNLYPILILKFSRAVPLPVPGSAPQLFENCTGDVLHRTPKNFSRVSRLACLISFLFFYKFKKFFFFFRFLKKAIVPKLVEKSI